MEVTASARFVRLSPQKAGLIAALVRGVPVDRAQVQLSFASQKAAVIIKKVLDSAVANAVHNFQLDARSLRISRVDIGQGPRLRRGKFVSRGRTARIMKPTAHITVGVESRVSTNTIPADKRKSK